MQIKENQRIILTKRLLYEGLLRLLEKKELHKITITELCAEAGINRATFYKHYSTPKDVLTDKMHQLIEEFLDNNPPSEFQKNHFTKEHLEKVCQYLYDNSAIVKILINNNMDGEISCILKNIPPKISFLRDDLGRDLDKDNLKLLSNFICFGGYYLIRQWILEDIQKTPEEIASLIFDISTKGWMRLSGNSPR